MPQNKKTSDNAIKMIDMYKTLFASNNGRLILHDLCMKCGMFQSSHTVGDSHSMAFNEGRRSVVIEILDIINKDQSKILQQFSESKVDYDNEFGR